MSELGLSAPQPFAAEFAPARPRTALASRLRVQLAGGVLVAVLMPAMLRDQAYLVSTATSHAIAGTLCALVLGFAVLRQVTAFAGVRTTRYILPAFALSYGLMIGLFFFFRIDYSRYQILASFIVAVSWFHAVQLLSQRALRPRIALVPGGRAAELSALAGVDWIPLSEPELPRGGIDGLAADLRSDFSPEWERFLARIALAGLPLHHAKQIKEALTGRVEIEHLSENSFGSVLPSLAYARLKRGIDIAGVLVAAPFLVPAIGLAALWIRLDSRGPAFFAQARIGRGGRRFTIYKLRTMRCEPALRLPYTLADDPRITGPGRFLRKYRIDEFPQILNILKGDMSWIGPRPEAVELAEGYERAIPFYAYRHVVRPGITGWAQVQQGNVAEIEAATSKLHYDFYYIKHFSPWLDALIVAKTIRTVCTGFGAR